jgi:hypothetical protein
METSDQNATLTVEGPAAGGWAVCVYAREGASRGVWTLTADSRIDA